MSRKKYRQRGIALAGCSLILFVGNGQALAQEATEAVANEIVVTAQKRAQSLSDVGITISVASEEQLRARRIETVNDLARLVPGFTVQESAFNSTSFTMRGVGFFNSDLSTPPTVSVYLDEAPVPYPAMAKHIGFDLQRVEVLKGPQGTLYGQNATGGAINYIVAKPTDTFDFGVDAGYGRFNTVNLGGFVSGPISDTLSVRVAVKGTHGDAWQRSTTRPGEKLGASRVLQGRFGLSWKPSDSIESNLTVTAWRDRSDTLASQFTAIVPLVPGGEDPRLHDQPIAKGPREADWAPGRSYRQNTRYIGVTLRNGIRLSDGIELTSLTNYSDLRVNYRQDFDATPLVLFDVVNRGGKANSFSQELRLSGDSDRFNWLIGANYSRDNIFEAPDVSFADSSGAKPFLACCGIINGGTTTTGDMNVETYGIFGNVEYRIDSQLSFQAALRYNKDKRDYAGCNLATPNPGDLGGGTAASFNLIQASSNDGSPITPILSGGCVILNPDDNYRPFPIVTKSLHEDNLSWKFAVNWKPSPGNLIYASVSKGYKAGTIPILGGAKIEQYSPIPQESVIAYEVGVKLAALDRRLRFNAAAFYYDYSKKQLRGKFLDPVFGPLEGLVSIPKSRVQGVEAQVILVPVDGLTIDASATYSDTKIQRFVGLDGLGVLRDLAGTAFPFSPKWQSVTDVQYEHSFGNGTTAYVGGTVTYNAKTNSGIGYPQILKIDAYTLVDARLGVKFDDGKYDVSLWGTNLTGKYYWTSTFVGFDALTRFPGRPRSYGVQFSYRFK